MLKNVRPYLSLIFIVSISSFILWLPFIFKASSWLGLNIDNSNFLYIYKHFDGPLYVIAAKTFYNPYMIERIGLELPFSPSYFAAHLPLYPLFIQLLATFFGYLRSMVAVNLIFTIFLSWFFYFMVKNLKLSKNPLLLTTVFLFLPRFLVIRSIGAPESLFIFLIFLSLYFFEKKKYLLAGLMGALATMTKTPGGLLFFVYLLVLAEKFFKNNKPKYRRPKIAYLGILSSIVFIPLGLLLVFYIYWLQTGDFFAYFHSGDNIHLVFPYSVFNFQKTWVGNAWLEDILFYFFLYFLTIFQLKGTKYRSLFYSSLVFFAAIIFVQHRDIARYSLPLWPLACIGSERFFTSKKFLISFFVLLPAIYFYAWNFLLFNIMPISDWGPFL